MAGPFGKDYSAECSLRSAPRRSSFPACASGPRGMAGRERWPGDSACDSAPPRRARRGALAPSHDSMTTHTHTLRDLLIDQLNDLYDAEGQLLDALPKMAEAASGENLRQGFLDHCEETTVHVERLTKAFGQLGIAPGEKTCLAMQGLVAEGAEALGFEASGAIRDAALIGAARRVEHYEIAAYQSARGLAAGVDEAGVADLLQQTLDEECAADKRLCTLGDLVIEAARESTGEVANAPRQAAPAKPAKKKSR